jgi:hypothetical protein
MRKCLLFALALMLVAVTLAASPVLAKTTVAKTTEVKKNAANKEKALGTFGSWGAYSYTQGGQTVCYMVTTQTVKVVGPSKRMAPYLMITHRPVEASTDVFSYGAGVLLNTRHGVQLTLGKTTFDLFAVRDIAWARDALTDHKIAAALRLNTRALTKAVPDKKSSKSISDQFDLRGAPGAYSAISKACGLPVDKPKTVKRMAKTHSKKVL